MSILNNQIKSKYGLGGGTPENRAGASNRSQMHVQGRKALTVNPSDSLFDLDGNIPTKQYIQKLPK